jgi:hypothetical protein
MEAASESAQEAGSIFHPKRYRYPTVNSMRGSF